MASGYAMAGLVVAVLLLLLVVLPGWIFGGGSLLYVGGRLLAKSPRATYWWSIATNAASVVAGAVASGLIAGIGLLGFGLDSGGMWAAVAAAFAAGLAANWAVIRFMFGVSFGRAALAWLPTAWQLILQPAVVLAIATPIATAGRTEGDRAVCAVNLRAIGQACQVHAAMSQDRFPTDLQVLVDEGNLPKDLRCPSAARRGVRARGGSDYFYSPGRDGPEASSRIVACDYKANHHGEGRHILLRDGDTFWMAEPAFQAAVARPENRGFAAALRAAEGP